MKWFWAKVFWDEFFFFSHLDDSVPARGEGSRAIHKAEQDKRRRHPSCSTGPGAISS